MESINIRETTQVSLADHLIGVGNVWEEEYTGPAGEQQTGPRATLSIRDQAAQRDWRERVAVGSEIRLGEAIWRVESIQEGESSPGSVTLTRVTGR